LIVYYIFFPWELEIYWKFARFPLLRPHGGGFEALVGMWQLDFLFRGLDMAWGQVANPVEYIVLEDRWNPWRLMME
jgi:hypothetical protein